jgi:hypothetical protein
MTGGTRLIATAFAFAALAAPPADASDASEPWPPRDGPGLLFAHFGEEHWNDDDSDLTLPQLVADTARYRPDLVTMSADKANDGTVQQLSRWRQIMSAYDRAGVPYLAGTGNHDRKSPPGVPPGTAGLLTPEVQGNLSNYKSIFADRPYPFGDASPYEGIGPSRPATDPAGASSHYYADIGDVRWIFLDNSCWGLSDCDAVQSPDFPDAEGIRGQFEFLERKAREATESGRIVFVVMHIPTRDPRDQSQINETSFNHVMGKGISPTQSADNGRFEEVAERSSVDAVFVGHIKGQWLYRGRGGIPYYIDGGAGGELYTDGPLGTDHGYWHGYRLVRVHQGRISTDVVPIIGQEAITVSGPDRMRRRQVARFEAVATQQKTIGEPIELELRDPDPIPRRPDGALDQLGAFMSGDGLILVPPAALVALLLLQSAGSRGRRLIFAPATAAIAVGGLGAIAIAQQSIPTSTPKSSLPNPARIWTSSDRFVLAPLASSTDDPRRSRTQTQDGAFRARCPGNEKVTIASGFEESSKPVVVPSRKGRIARRLSIRGRTARVRLRQRAEVIARVKRRKRIVRNVRKGCFRARKARRFHWDRRIKRHGKLRPARPGKYKLQVLVPSDRKTLRRSRTVRIR